VRISLQVFSLILITLNYANEVFLYFKKNEFIALTFSNSVELSSCGLGASIFLHGFYLICYLFVFSILKQQVNFSFEALKNNRMKFFLLLVFTVLSFLKIKSILAIGVVNFLIQTRGNEGGVGGITYIILIGWPILMLVYKFSFWEKLLSWTLLIVLNLLTGFRILLLISLLLHIVNRLRRGKYVIKFKLMVLIACLLYGSFIFTLSRVEPSVSVDSFSTSFLSSFNRSNSVLTVAYAHDKSIVFPLIGFMSLTIQPIEAFISYFVGGAYSPNTYEIRLFSEVFYKNFLYLRGTDLYYASGFSNTILLVMFAHFSWLSLLVIPFFLFTIMFSIFTFKVKNIYSSVGVSIFYTFFLISSIESYSVGIGYLFYGLFFLFFLRIPYYLKFLLYSAP